MGTLKAFSLKVYPELEMFAPFSPEENGIRGYPQGYGIRENALSRLLLLPDLYIAHIAQIVP